MAINEEELRISNKSYINKDFDAAYEELLTLARKISYKYDPTSSNESDPFIVLLKLLAFTTDKVNYNIDKNILERFMPSATQESSMQELTSRLGYNMHYYISGETGVLFKYDYPTSWTGKSITIPRGSILSDYSNSVQYVTLKKATIRPQTGTSSDPVLAIEGELKILTILGDSKIHLENLDSNNRLYFPEIRVAQNGVFIHGGSIPEKYVPVDSEITDWVCVDNLNTQNYGYPCFTFRFDSIRQLPYLQFPDWINVLIGDGIEIEYIISSGAAGNVRAENAFFNLTGAEIAADFDGTDLENLGVSSTDDIISKIKIVNVDSASNGANPETIDEAYNGFKKTIGTFKTLVTCRDFANAIYNYLDENGDFLVSNVHVSDRRTDINYGCNVVQYKDPGVQTKSIITQSDDGPVITAYEMCIYAFNQMQDPKVYIWDKAKDYNRSFSKFYDDSKIESVLEDGLDNLKTISHDYKSFQAGDIYAIKNYYKLNVILATNTKVDTIAQQEICNNVKIALARNFNARKVDFGYEIPYELLLKTIEQADERIKSVGLAEPEQYTRAMIVDTDTSKTRDESIIASNNIESNNWYKKLVAQNILSGKVEMFDYNDTFDYDWGQKTAASAETQDIETITSIAAISLGTSDPSNTYKLQKNEIVQFAAPNYVSKIIYPYGVYYSYKPTQDTDTIPANTLYRVTANNNLKVAYKESETAATYTVKDLTGVIIKANFTIQSTSNGYKTINGVNYRMLGTNEQIEELAQSKKTLDKDNIKCYWQLNNFLANEDMSIPWDGNQYYLEEGEYFFYTLDDVELFIYGSGTKLVKHGNQDWTITANNRISDPSALINEGIKGFVKYFKNMSFSSDNLDIEEQQIITLTENDVLKSSAQTGISIPQNVFENLTAAQISSLTYKIENADEEDNVYSSFLPGITWAARSLLQLNISPSVQQTLLSNQRIVLVDTAGTETTFNSGKSLLTNIPINPSGGSNVKVAYVETYTDQETGDNEVEIKYPSVYSYEIDSNAATYLNYLDEHHYSLKVDEGILSLDFTNYNGGVSYSEYAIVKYNNNYYISKIDDNDTVPTTTTNWKHLGSTIAAYDAAKNDYNKYDVVSDTDTNTRTSYYVAVNANMEKDKLKDLDYWRSVTKNTLGDIKLPEAADLETDLNALVMIYVGKNNQDALPNYLTINSTGGNIVKYNAINPGSSATTMTIDSEGMTIIKLDDDVSALSFEVIGDSISVVISQPRYVRFDTNDKAKNNVLLGLQQNDIIEDYLKTNFEQQFENFYCINYPDNAEKIELFNDENNKRFLNSPLAFYDYNNVGNAWVIPQIDFKNSSITIAKSSMR